jgi:hypothetical protein
LSTAASRNANFQIAEISVRIETQIRRAIESARSTSNTNVVRMGADVFGIRVRTIRVCMAIKRILWFRANSIGRWSRRARLSAALKNVVLLLARVAFGVEFQTFDAINFIG